MLPRYTFSRHSIFCRPAVDPAPRRWSAPDPVYWTSRRRKYDPARQLPRQARPTWGARTYPLASWAADSIHPAVIMRQVRIAQEFEPGFLALVAEFGCGWIIPTRRSDDGTC